MILAIFLVHISSRSPIVIIPSHFGSRLYMNTTHQPFWYCPAAEHNKHAWIRVRDLGSPFLTCLLDHLTVSLNSTTGNLTSRPNTTFSTLDFGGVDGILGIGPEFLGRYLPVNYELFVNTFIQKGYKVHQDLFGAPYDWRFGLDQPEEYFSNLKSLIETAYNKNNGKSVAVLAHGLGATLAHLFLTDDKKTGPEWRKKYIDSATYVSPSWSGSGQAFFSTWRLRFPFVHVRFDTLRQFVASLGAFHASFPNTIAYGNNTLLIGPDGEKYTAADLIDIIKKHGKLSKEQLEIAERNFKFTKMLPKNPDFNVNIVFNSGVPTPMGLKLKDWNDVGAPIYGHGDSLVGSRVIEQACDTWGTKGIRVRCHDALSDQQQYHHRYLLKNLKIATLISKWIANENYDDVDLRVPKKILSNEL